MGHCTLPSHAPAATADKNAQATGTDLPAGNAPAPPLPKDWYADRYFPKADMEHARHVMMAESGAQTFAFLSINMAEIRPIRGRNGYRWSGEAWWGGDINRLTLKSDGEGRFGKPIDDVEVQALFSRAIGPYFNAQAGIRQDLGRGPRRTYAAVGIEGLAPFWFELEATLFVSDKGDILGRIEGYYDQRITQRLILQPRAELNFAAQDIPSQRIGSGLSDYEVGTRLRYEITRQVAPYVGIEWHRKLSKTARYSIADGDKKSSVLLTIGIKSWF